MLLSLSLLAFILEGSHGLKTLATTASPSAGIAILMPVDSGNASSPSKTIGPLAVAISAPPISCALETVAAKSADGQEEAE